MKPKVLYCQYACREHGRPDTYMSGYHLTCDLTDNSAMLGVVVTRYADDVVIIEQSYCFVDWNPGEQYESSRQLIQDKYTKDYKAIRQGVELFDILMDTFGYKLFPDLFPPTDDPCTCLPDHELCASCQRKAKQGINPDDDFPF